MYQRSFIALASFIAVVALLGPTPIPAQSVASYGKLMNGEWTGTLLAQTKELKAADVKLVLYSKGKKVSGAFTYVDKKTWVEDNSDGRHRFTETARDEWSVYLDVDNGGYAIQIDLYKKQIFITEKGKNQRELYSVLKAY